MRTNWMAIAALLLSGLAIFSNGWAEELSGKTIDGIRVIRMEAFRYGYRPDPVVVKAGEKVRLLLNATDVTHGFGIAELGINRKLPSGKVTEIEFTAPETGTYTIYCTVFCGPDHGEMEGRLVVQ